MRILMILWSVNSTEYTNVSNVNFFTLTSKIMFFCVTTQIGHSKLSQTLLNEKNYLIRLPSNPFHRSSYFSTTLLPLSFTMLLSILELSLIMPGLDFSTRAMILLMYRLCTWEKSYERDPCWWCFVEMFWENDFCHHFHPHCQLHSWRHYRHRHHN